MINILNWPIVRDFLINFLGVSYVAKLNAKIESLGFFEKISGQLVKGQSHKLSPEMLQNTRRSLIRRANLCIEMHGGHFEQLL
jgi:hypothetical protein